MHTPQENISMANNRGLREPVTLFILIKINPFISCPDQEALKHFSEKKKKRIFSVILNSDNKRPKFNVTYTTYRHRIFQFSGQKGNFGKSNLRDKVQKGNWFNGLYHGLYGKNKIKMLWFSIQPSREREKQGILKKKERRFPHMFHKAAQMKPKTDSSQLRADRKPFKDITIISRVDYLWEECKM